MKIKELNSGRYEIEEQFSEVSLLGRTRIQLEKILVHGKYLYIGYSKNSDTLYVEECKND